MLDIVTLAVFGGSALFLHWLLKEPANLPPGPRRWPLLGSLPSMARYPMEKGHLAMAALEKQYGGLFTLKLGSVWMIVVADPDIAREVFVKQADKFSDRPVYSGAMKRAKKMFGGDFGIMWSSGENKKEVRKFTISAMREFGFGKRSLLERIGEESRSLCAEVGKRTGKPWNPRRLLSEAVSNVICSICFGERYAYDDEEFVALMSLLHKISESTTFVDVSMFFDWLSFLPLSKKAKESMALSFKMQDWIAKKIEEHEKTYDPSVSRDFIDLYIKHKEENHGTISGHVMKMIILDLYFAGSDTTSTALTWLLKFLIAYPEVQRKCREEVDRVIGRDRSPAMTDKAEMPYTEATINETLRLSSTAPTSLPHYAMESGSVRGYTIPAGSTALLSIYPINMDPRRWPEPEKFRPERWIDETTGQCTSKNEHYVGFGLGPRGCLGEGLARQEMFLFTTSLLQKFTFHKENEDEELNFDGLQGITLQPTPYQLIAHPRPAAQE